jgi:hypothetical protein
VKLLDLIPSSAGWVAFGVGFILGLVGLLLPERNDRDRPTVHHDLGEGGL